MKKYVGRLIFWLTTCKQIAYLLKKTLSYVRIQAFRIECWLQPLQLFLNGSYYKTKINLFKLKCIFISIILIVSTNSIRYNFNRWNTFSRSLGRISGVDYGRVSHRLRRHRSKSSIVPWSFATEQTDVLRLSGSPYDYDDIQLSIGWTISLAQWNCGKLILWFRERFFRKIDQCYGKAMSRSVSDINWY